METEISGRVRNVELVKIIDWIPKVWHHLNRFLEAHSSSDVTIGRWEARWQLAGRWGGRQRGDAAPGALASSDHSPQGPDQDSTLQAQVNLLLHCPYG